LTDGGIPKSMGSCGRGVIGVIRLDFYEMGCEIKLVASQR